MAKLKNIIRQLSDKDYKAIQSSLMESNAEKSAMLLESLREKHISDTAIMAELSVNTNAYYTLRSRLNQKIEEYLLEQVESPRTDLLKKVANINEIIFTSKKALAIATLKKLERELIDYDLSNELTSVYKALKKLHINTQDHFTYSQAYNKHVAFMLAIDKAEDLLAEYFKKYSEYTLTGSETGKLELTLLKDEMFNVAALYESHRLYVYKSCIHIFHLLFVVASDEEDPNEEPIEDVIEKVEGIFKSYHQDSIYYHLNLVFQLLKFEYYTHYRVFRKAETYFEEVNDAISNLLSNYNHYTFPAQFLISKLQRHIRLGTADKLEEENEGLFIDYEIDRDDLSTYITYVVYRSICCYYAKEYEEAARWINNLLNDVSLKKYPYAALEIKMILALQYCLLNDFDLFNQLVNSIQRQIRLLGKEKFDNLLVFSKILKTSISDVKKNKGDKIKGLIAKMTAERPIQFAPTQLIKMDDNFVSRLA